MKIYFQMEELPFSEGYYVLRHDIELDTMDEQERKFKDEITQEMYLNLKEQYGGAKIW